MNRYDAIVIGVGAMGSAALYHLSCRGIKVLGLERFFIGHDRGSSHGQTRIIRKAYFENPAYIPLLHRSYDLWARLEEASGRRLVHRVGLLLVGRGDGAVIPRVKRAAQEHQLAIEPLTIQDMNRRFPGFAADVEMEALFESNAGFLEAESSVEAHVEQAVAHGATILTGQVVQNWSADSCGVVVTTTEARYSAEMLVICGGAWSTRLLSELDLPLRVRRKVVFWYAPRNNVYSREQGCPVFCFDTDEGFFYGFPVLDELGMKVANHSDGQVIPNPDQIERTLKPEDELCVQSFLNKYLPDARPTLTKHSVCMYTMTPDEDFIIDRHRDHSNVVYAAGLSGHGFKFAPIIGSILADLVEKGETEEPIDFLAASRPSIRVV